MNTYNQKPGAASTNAAPEKNLDSTETLAFSTFPIAEVVNPVEAEAPPAEDGNFATIKHFTTGAVLKWLNGPTASWPVASFISESACASWLVNMLHGACALCPECGLALDGSITEKFFAGKRCFCPACGLSFSAKSGTFLQGTHMEFRQVFLLAVLIDLMETGITPARIAELVGISADTVRLWIKKFKAFEDHGR